MEIFVPWKKVKIHFPPINPLEQYLVDIIWGLLLEQGKTHQNLFEEKDISSSVYQIVSQNLGDKKNASYTRAQSE